MIIKGEVQLIEAEELKKGCIAEVDDMFYLVDAITDKTVTVKGTVKGKLVYKEYTIKEAKRKVIPITVQVQFPDMEIITEDKLYKDFLNLIITKRIGNGDVILYFAQGSSKDVVPEANGLYKLSTPKRYSFTATQLIDFCASVGEEMLAIPKIKEQNREDFRSTIVPLVTKRIKKND